MQKAIYTTVAIDELLPHVQALKSAGARFVQMHAERVDGYNPLAVIDAGFCHLAQTFCSLCVGGVHIVGNNQQHTLPPDKGRVPIQIASENPGKQHSLGIGNHSDGDFFPKKRMLHGFPFSLLPAGQHCAPAPIV